MNFEKFVLLVFRRVGELESDTALHTLHTFPHVVHRDSDDGNDGDDGGGGRRADKARILMMPEARKLLESSTNTFAFSQIVNGLNLRRHTGIQYGRRI